MPQTEPSEPTATPRRFSWRRLLQYRLRTLLIVTTLVAVWLAWWSHTARRQRDAVARITQAKGWILYDFHQEHLAMPRYWPEWLVEHVGVDHFATVGVAVYPKRTAFEAEYPKDNVHVFLRGIGELSSLEIVRLDEAPVADADLESFGGLRSLRSLSLDGTGVSDVGLAKLKGLHGLRYLGLNGTQITDAGLKHIAFLKELEGLGIIGTRVTESGMEQLRNLPALKVINLDDTMVTDAGIEPLNALGQLEYISLGNTPITDAGLKHLEGLAHLKLLLLNNTQVTRAGVARLKQALPMCSIHH